MRKNAKQYICLIISLCILLVTFVPVFADYNDWTPLAQKCYDMFVEIYDTTNDDDTLKLLTFDSSSANVTNYTGFDGAKATVYQTMIALYDAFKTVGFMFCMLYFLIDLIDKTTKEQLNLEHFLRQFIKLLIAVLLIDHGLDIVSGVMSLSTAFIDKVSNANYYQSNVGGGTAGTAELIRLQNLFDSENRITQSLVALGFMAVNILPWIIIQMVKIVIALQVWSRLIEICIRVAVAPIGMADTFTNGFNGAGFRYFKKLCAVIMQGLFIAIILKICGAISGNAVFSGNNMLAGAQMILIGFIEIGLIKKSQSFSNDLLGV